MKFLDNLNQKGAALISVLIVLPFLLLIAYNYTRLGVNNINLAQYDQFRTQTQMVADASIDYAVQQINQNSNWTGTGSEITFDTLGNVKTTYFVTVTNPTSDKKVITTTAKLYRPANSSIPQSSITINTDLRPVSAGDFSIVTGVGGLYMQNSAKVLGGSIFVNGSISMANTAQIGLQLSPVNLSVAHQTCPNPPDATYPRVCGSGENGQPISLQNQAHIYGTVTANNQISGTGMSNPGLVGSSGVTPQALPVHDRAAQKAAATNNMTAANASCTTNNGTKIWPAKTKITGNVTVSKSCVVTIQGDVWITGTLTMTQSGTIKVSDALGTTQPNLMVDGNSVNLSNTSGIANNSSGKGVQLISYYSTAPCSPDCSNVTGTDLKTSRDYTGIQLDNSASGPATVFYARWTKVRIANSGQIGALIGQTVSLENSGTITFGTSVGTGTKFWVIDGYRRSF